MKKIALVSFISLISVVTQARTDCSVGKIDYIQIENQKILYRQESAPWRTLGSLNNEDGTRERYSALLTAQAAGKSVLVGYSDNSYDCSATNYTTSAYLVRIYN